MIEDILEFYEKIKNKRQLRREQGTPTEAPITYTHIFHKTYPRMNSIILPQGENSGELSVLLSRRSSTRVYDKKPITLEELGRVLSSTRIVEKFGEFERRTYPSGGARFPVEIYPIVFNVEGLERGVYHYNLPKSSLEQLWKKDLNAVSEDFISPFVKNPAVALVFSSVLSRSEIKYGAKALPFSLLEAGHMAQNMSLVAEKLNLGYCPIGGYLDEEVSSSLDILDDEIPLYVFTLGKKLDK